MALTKVKTGVVDDSVFAANKNVIINGNFDIWQRGTSFIPTANAAYTTDRWQWFQVGTGIIDMLQSTSVPDNTSDFSLQVDVTTADTSIAAGDFYVFLYKVEGYDNLRFAYGTSDAKQLTLSFWVKSAKTGIHCVAFRNAGNDRSYVVEYTVSIADTWEQKSITLTADTTGTWLTDNGIGVSVLWALAVGTTFHNTANTWNATGSFATSNQVNVMDSAANNFHIAQVQLELGSTATTFERRSFAQEFSMAQRYYWTTVGQVQSTQATGSFEKATSMLIYPQEMRAVPSIALQADGFRTNLRAGSSGLTVTGTTSSGTNLFIESSPPAAGTSFSITGETITFDAEL